MKFQRCNSTFVLALYAVVSAFAPMPGQAQRVDPEALKNLPSGKVVLWKERGEMTPALAYWGAASLADKPDSRLPAPPFQWDKNKTESRTSSPKFSVTDANGVDWTVKLGVEVHADIAASRLAWVLGFGAEEEYYVSQGKVEGITPDTDLKYLGDDIKADGAFTNARFKRKDKEFKGLEDAKGEDIVWDLRTNPGVPNAQLSGLKILDVLVHNWDAQPKNCKVFRAESAEGPENWFIMSDWGASFGDMKSKWNLEDYKKETAFVREVRGGVVHLNFRDAINSQADAHKEIPLADAQWFRARLAALSAPTIRAAFHAAFASSDLNAVYRSGDEAKMAAAVLPEADQYAEALRRRVIEFLSKVPAEGKSSAATSALFVPQTREAQAAR